MGLGQWMHWARKASGKRRPRPARRPFWRTILRLELLEDRVTPSAVSWTGAGDGTSWTDPHNWSDNATPGSNDDVTINRTFANVKHTGTDTVNSLSVLGGTLDNSGSLTTGALTLGGSFDTITNTGTLTANGTFTWTNGGLNGSGDTVLNGASSLSGGFFSMLTDQTIDNHGTATITDGNSIDFSGNAVWNNDAGSTFDLQGTGTIGNFFASSASAFNNYGTFQKSGNATTAGLGVAFNNNSTGTVDVQTGTFSLSTGGTSSGDFTIESGATLQVNSNYTLQGGSITGAGTFQENGGTLTVATATNLQNLTVTGGTVLANAALTVQQQLTASGGSVNANTGSVTAQDLSLAGGFFGGPTLTGSGTITVNGAFDWTGGTLNGSGDTVLNGTSNFDVASSFFSPLSRRLDNYGTATVTGGTSLTFENSAVFNNEAGATLNLPDSVSLGNFFSGGSQLNNAGLVQTTTPAGNANVGILFNNTGSVDVQTGTLTLSGGGSSSGTITMESGATLNVNSNYTLQGGTITGAGTFQVSGNTLTVAALTNLQNLSVTGGIVLANAALGVQNLTDSGGTVNANTGTVTVQNVTLAGGLFGGPTLTGPGTITVNGAFDWKGGTLNGSGDTVLNGTSTFEIINSFFSPLSRRVDNYGTATVTGGTSLTFENDVVFNNEAGATLVMPDSASIGTFFSPSSQLNNAGLLQKISPANTATIGIMVDNTGTIEVDSGALSLSGGLTNFSGTTLTGGSYVLHGGVLQIPNADIHTNDATVVLDGPSAELFNSGFFSQNDALINLATNASGSSLTIENGRNLNTPGAFSNAGAITVGTGSVFTAKGNYTQTSGATVVNGTLNANTTVAIDGGSLSGSGTINANVVSAGIVTPGDAPAILTVNGTYTQTPTGTLAIQISGPNPGTGYSRLAVTGTASLAGALDVSDPNNYKPNAGDTFEVLTFASHTGDFSAYNGLDLGNGRVLQPQYVSGDTGLDLVTYVKSNTVVTSSATGNTSTYGQDVTFTATVSAADGTSPAGTVQFQIDGSDVGSPVPLNNGQATFDAGTSLAAATYQVTAVYASAAPFYLGSTSPATTYTVTPAPLTVTIPNLTKTYGQTLDLASALGTTVDTGINGENLDVTYSSDGAAASADVIPGGYPITAQLSDGTGKLSNYSVTVVPGTLTVNPAVTSTSGSVSSATPYFGQAVTFTADVTASPSSPATPVGSVDFFDLTTNTDLGTGTLTGGVATLTTSAPLPDGTQTIVLSYVGNADFLASLTTVTVSVLPSAYVLDATADGALSLTGSASINVPGLVQVDSSSSRALTETGGAQTTAAAIQIVGGDSVKGGAGFSTTPVTNAAAVADPLAGLPVPPSGLPLQGAVDLGGGSSLTINPGVYTQIRVSNSATLTLNPGVYVIAGGGLSVSGAATLTGSGVLIYNAGSNYLGSGDSFGGITITEGGSVNLTAPTSGPYAGVALFQSRDNTQGISVSGTGVLELNDGALYAPAAQVTLDGSGALEDASLVVDQLHLTGTAAYTATAGATPADAASVALGNALANVLSGGSSQGGSLPLANINSTAFQTALEAVLAEWQQGGPGATQALDSLLAIVNSVTGLTKDPSQYS